MKFCSEVSEVSERGRAEREVLVPVWDKPEPYFIFSASQKRQLLAARLNPWRVVSDDKGRPAHKQASTCESLLNIYPEAIEVGSPFGTVPKWWGVAGAVVGLMGFLLCASAAFDMAGYIYIAAFSVFFSLMFMLVCLFFLRLAFFAPKDFPVLFNRKDRVIHYFSPKKMSFFKFWKGGGYMLGESKWGDIKIRCYKYAEFTTKTAHDSYSLALLHGRRDDPKLVEAVVDLGYKGWWEDERLFRLWEHIRRYMEEGGPPIQPGETLRTTGHGKLPKFPAEIITAAGGPAFSAEAVAALAGSAPTSVEVEASKL